MRWPAALAIVLSAIPAHAHVAPSLDDNNRYLTVTPAADRVRLAYTVVFGEVPGAQARRTIDTDRDGAISDAEARAFADKLAAEVGPALALAIDGVPQGVTWSTVAAGMGDPRTTGGAFAIDLIAWICLPTVRGPHTVELRDRFRIPRPGETQIVVEGGPGIEVESTRIGQITDATDSYTFQGAASALANDSLHIAFVATGAAPLTSEHACRAPADRTAGAAGKLPTLLVVGGAIALVMALAIAALLIHRGRAARRRDG